MRNYGELHGRQVVARRGTGSDHRSIVEADGAKIGWVVKISDFRRSYSREKGEPRGRWAAYLSVPNSVEGRYVGDSDTLAEGVDELAWRVRHDYEFWPHEQERAEQVRVRERLIELGVEL